MSKRLAEVFARCEAQNKAALVGYLIAGDPSPETSEKLMLSLAEHVDIIEIGMPFSDPMADGPVIQAASERALAAGTHFDDVLHIATSVRQKYPDIGIVLMGYANVPYTIGFEIFADKASTAGVDGVLLVDIPAEESALCVDIFKKYHLSQIMLLAPTSTDERIKLAAATGQGFIYYVSLAGITGAEMGEVAKSKDKVSLIRQYSKLPICVGFGVKTTQQATDLASFADGVVVGSHFVSQITSSNGIEDVMVNNLSASASALALAMYKEK
ncbi:MAG: tryptophan synthase subunit alpha [Ghiorsea sp.]|nr:tryptophan synthase subunit alpha [Ghiorsea sp.]